MVFNRLEFLSTALAVNNQHRPSSDLLQLSAHHQDLKLTTNLEFYNQAPELHKEPVRHSKLASPDKQHNVLLDSAVFTKRHVQKSGAAYMTILITILAVLINSDS